MSRLGLLIVSLIAVAACSGGAQLDAGKPAPECRAWPNWQDFPDLPSLKYRLRFCGYDEDTKEQLWEAQFRNDHRWGVSFSYALGDEPTRHRMDLPPSRTRSSVPLLRASAATPDQMVWLQLEGYCVWAAGERSCSPP